ncbi:SRPBCC family protein [Dyella sp. LX-66]|uniref:SRPBCC family protein n=1 Tax=unclassified Dyella TaxID=2634549 RepID=UPI001BE01D84|nr:MULTISPECIES: SRPBCC family protein [unclassified Dyella]MBT2117627.1 SRPBCC family protein [Dyella sp. LX-1]MBT2141369.1 SRPBCC family protein [Dyella sp. LX-66]
MLIVLAVLVIALAIVLAIAAGRPDHFRIERSATLAAPPESVYPLIEDFHRWRTWSPYEERDPAMRRDYSGAPHGRGAIYAWDGNKQIGTGRMEILEATPSSRIAIQLDFFKPFKAHNTAEFLLEPTTTGTRITWTMQGPSPFMSKLMGLVFNFDRMVGKDFEVGLEKLRAVAEG